MTKKRVPPSLGKLIRIGNVITPRLTAWLVNNPEGVIITEKSVKVLDAMTGEQQRKADCFHPSSLHQCARKQVFDFIQLPVNDGISISPELLQIFNDGKWRHLRWQCTLLNADLLTDIETPVSIGGLRLEGSMDGDNDDEDFSFELKGTSGFSTVVKDGVLPSHAHQAQAYLMASGRPRHIIIYEDKFSQRWHEIVLTPDKKQQDELHRILNGLNEAIDNQRLPAILPACRQKKGDEYKDCPYSQRCLKAHDWSEAKALGALFPHQRRNAQGSRDPKGTRRVRRRVARKKDTTN